MSSNTSQSQSYSSSSYSTYSSSSYSSSSSSDPRGTSKRYTEESSYNDRDGHTLRRTQEETGKPTLQETTQIPVSGRGLTAGDGTDRQQGQQGRIQDVTDDNEEGYEERMEDEYAKREGGA